MSTLHIVRQSAFSNNDFAQCLSVLGQQDTLVLMDDGCYNLKHTLMASLIEQTNNTNCINVITSHAQARALEIQEGVIGIEMSDVVELTFTNQKVITWQ